MEGMQQTLTEMLARFNTMTTEVAGIAGEVRSMRQHMEDFGEDLDGVKRRLAERDKPDKQQMPRVEIPSATQATSAALLMNKGAPLMDKPTKGDQIFQTAPSSPNHESEQFKVRPPKHDFPRFNGEAPILWIDLCLTYFDMYKIPEHQWVSTATLYLEGHAALWLQAFKRMRHSVSWPELVAAVVEEFGHDEFDGQMTRLMQLKQIGTVSEYRLAFEDCMYHLIALDETLSTRWFVAQFVFGLRDDIRGAVRLQAPSSIARSCLSCSNPGGRTGTSTAKGTTIGTYQASSSG